MKKSFKTLALAAIATMFSIAATNAAEPTKPAEKKSFDVGMYQVINTMDMKLMVEKNAGTSVEIRLKNDHDETIYSEVSNKKATKYAKKFKLDGLADGKYTFEISSGKEKIVKEFELSTKIPVPADYRTIALK